MRRKVLLGVGVLVVVVIWLGWRGHREASSSRVVGRGEAAASGKPPTAAPRAPRPNAWRDEVPAGGLRLEGQVVDPDGKGVAGASVALVAPARTAVTEADGSFAFDQLVTGAYTLEAARGALVGGPVGYRLTEHSDPLVIRLASASAVVVTVVDDAARPVGGARVHVERGALDRTELTDAQGVARIAPVRPEYVDLEVQATGFGNTLARVAVGSPNRTVEVTVTLRRGAVISGRVTDDAGQPIAGAQVTPNTWEYDPMRDAAGVSDAHGDYVLAAVPPGRYTVTAVDGEHAPVRSKPVVVADQPVGHVDVVMPRGGRVTGVVIDGQHRPVVSARVTAYAPRSDAPSYRQAIADAQGRFELRGLARAALQLRGDTAGARSAVLDVDLATAAEREVELVLDVRGAIAGVVVDDHGAPAPEVEVQATRKGVLDTQYFVVMTGGDGKFVMRGLEDGDYVLSAMWRPGASQVRRSDVDFGTPAHTGDQSVHLVLATPGKVIGRFAVAGATGPLQPATIYLGPAFTTSQPDGTFQLDEVTPGTWELMAHGAEFSDVMRGGLKVESGATLDLGAIAVRRGRTLRGTVVGPDGAPLAGAQVRIDFRYDLPAGTPPTELDRLQPARTATTGPDGRFTLYGLPERPTSVTADDVGRGRSASLPIAAGTDDPPPVALSVKR